jgi:tRNA(adenine34) deaminase
MSIELHNFFMEKALALARCAFYEDEIPVGAVVTYDGKVIGEGYNQIESKKTHQAHAEQIAIKKATEYVGNWRLNDCTLYVTLEPCLMCLGLVMLSRITTVVFATKSTLFGSGLYCSKTPTYAKKLTIFGGVKEKESVELIKSFFNKARKKKGFVVEHDQLFLDQMKERLLTKRMELTDMLTESSNDAVSDGQVQDSGDEALSLTMEKLKSSLEQSEIDELKLIEDALKRIEKGAFGYCVECEEKISAKRLEHFPYAARCIVCQEKLEQN